MQRLPSMLVGASLLAVMMPAAAMAAPFGLAHPQVDQAWGGRPGMPTAPSMTVDADTELQKTLTGTERTAEYVRRMLVSPATLDEAIRFHLYLPIRTFTSATDYRGPPMPAETSAQSDAVAAKMRSAEPGLLAELDARFAALTTSMQRADSIVLPTRDVGVQNAVLYCRFIYVAGLLPRPGLGELLWKRCIDDRDAFLDALVKRMAELAVIPRLPTAPNLTRPTPFNPWVRTDLVLSPMVLPGELKAPLPMAQLDAPFQKRLGERFEEASPKLLASLQATLEHVTATDIYLAPATLCTAVLGPYADSLPNLPAAATVAAHARDAGLADARIDAVPSARCATLVGPHFPVGQVVDVAPRGAVYAACRDKVAETEAVIIDRHLAAAVEASRPDPDTLQGWEAHAWFAQPPGGTGWIAPGRNPSTAARFRAAYEATMAPRRKEAASRLAEGIPTLFAVDTGIEPEAAATACKRSYPTAGDNVFAAFWGTGSPRPSSPPTDAYQARPALTAPEADAWIGMTCRDLHARTLARRRSLAREAGHVEDLFQDGLKLAIRAPNGELRPIDPAKLVETAATEMLQVMFVPGGMMSRPRMAITPFGRSAPSMAGSLVETTRNDGKAFLEVVGLRGFPDLDGPLATIACVAMPVGQAQASGRLKIFTAGTAAFFGDSFILAGMMEDEAQQELLDVGACAAAKRAFLYGEASR